MRIYYPRSMRAVARMPVLAQVKLFTEREKITSCRSPPDIFHRKEAGSDAKIHSVFYLATGLPILFRDIYIFDVGEKNIYIYISR